MSIVHSKGRKADSDDDDNFVGGRKRAPVKPKPRAAPVKRGPRDEDDDEDEDLDDEEEEEKVEVAKSALFSKGKGKK